MLTCGLRAVESGNIQALALRKISQSPEVEVDSRGVLAADYRPIVWPAIDSAQQTRLVETSQEVFRHRSERF